MRLIRKPAMAAVVALGMIVAAHAASPQGEDAGLAQMQAQLTGVLDREAIRQLPITYAHYVRARDIDGIVSLFTKDGRLILPANLGGDVTGTSNLKTFYAKAIAGADPWPFFANHYVTVDGDHAKGTIDLEMRYGTQGFKTVLIGVYSDEYRKEDGVWKIVSRSLAATPLP